MQPVIPNDILAMGLPPTLTALQLSPHARTASLMTRFLRPFPPQLFSLSLAFEGEPSPELLACLYGVRRIEEMTLKMPIKISGTLSDSSSGEPSISYLNSVSTTQEKLIITCELTEPLSSDGSGHFPSAPERLKRFEALSVSKGKRTLAHPGNYGCFKLVDEIDLREVTGRA